MRHAMPIAVVLVAAAAHAGIVSRRVSSGEVETAWVEGNKLRVERQGKVMIFDGDAQKVIEIDPAGHSYSEMTEKDMRAMGEKARVQMKKVQQQARTQLAKLPPEQRKMMEKYLAQAEAGESGGSAAAAEAAPATKRQYVRAGGSRTVAGHSCDMYRVTEGGGDVEQQCILPWSAGVVKKSDLEIFKSMQRFYGQFAEGMGGQARKSGGDEMARMLDGPGVPLLIIRDGVQSEETTQLERTSVGADKFAVPAGYTKTISKTAAAAADQQ